MWPQSVFRNSAALKMKIKLLHRSRECIRALDSMPVQAFGQTRRFRKILIVVTGLAAFITHYSQDSPLGEEPSTLLSPPSDCRWGGTH